MTRWWWKFLNGSAPGYTPGGLRGAGATFIFNAIEDISFEAWRGRWDSAVLERYIQEAGVAVALNQLTEGTRSRIRQMAAAAPFVLRSAFRAPRG